MRLFRMNAAAIAVFLPAVFFLFSFRASAQVALTVEISQLNYLQYEPVYLRVSMRNVSGHPLAFGENEGLRGRLRFEINAPGRNQYASLLGSEYPTMRGVILQPGAARTFTFNVSKYYNLKPLGHYSIRAILSHPQLKAEYGSNQTHFSVVKGLTIWESSVGIPKIGTASRNNKSEMIETRKYSILSYNTGRAFFHALMIEDEERVYMVRKIALDLGRNLAPRCAIDDMSRLNIIAAASPKVYIYYQFDTNGKLEKRDVRIKTNTTPRLVVNRELGTVIVDGGRAARRDLDYEEIKELPFIRTAMEENVKDITEGKSILDQAEEEDE